MTSRIVIVLSVLLVAAAAVAVQPKTDSDEQAIKKVLRENYVEGMYIKHDREVLRAGLASTFVMQVYWDGKLSTTTRSQWLKKLKLSGVPTKKRVESTIKVLDIEGVAAVARVDLYVDSKHMYTDFFGLYKTEDGWKIVTKMFHAHQ